MRAASLFLIALLVALAPGAAADHVYSHRYEVYGRVVDAAGEPVAGARVLATFEGFDAEKGDCIQAPTPQPVTDAMGDFHLCAHVDASIPRAAAVALSVLGASTRVAADPDARVSFVRIALPSEAANASFDRASFDGSYEVVGRVWARAADGEVLEGIPVTGLALANASVEVAVEDVAGHRVAATAETSRYGTFSALVRAEAPLANGTLTIRQNGTVVTRPLDLAFHWDGMNVDVSSMGKASSGGGPVVAVVLGVVAATLVVGALVVARAKRPPSA